jgi:hypothetical protein
MLTLLMFFALQVTTAAEIACLDSISDVPVPSDLYIAGVELEGVGVLATQGQLVFLNGPGTGLLRVGEVKRVIRPEGKIRDPLTGSELGAYYRDLGTIRIEAVNSGSATARVVFSCSEMLKGDLVRPYISKPAVQFSGNMSNALTPIPENAPEGLILAGKNNLNQLAAGQFCFIGLGGRDGVKPGDRFTIFRPYPAFNPGDMMMAETGRFRNYGSAWDQGVRYKATAKLHKRVLPRMVLGDMVIVETGDKISAGRIVNSMTEIHPGDFVVKR